MQKRIISGVVMGAVVALVLVLGLKVDNIVITIFLSAVAALGVWELVVNAAGVKWIPFQIIPMIYTAVIVPFISMWQENMLKVSFNFNGGAVQKDIWLDDLYLPVTAAIITVVYFIICAVLILIKQADLDLAKIAVLCGMPLLLAFAFSTIGSIIIATGGIYYLLLILNFSSVCDMGAYFVGVSMGKTKLCPAISPKKTVEGAIGGIVSSIIVSLIIVLCYGYYDRILLTLLLTIPLCIAGMVGDLFASVIKRKVGIKDYGNLIPGHGGVLDRVDSMLFISPLIFCFVFAGII